MSTVPHITCCVALALAVAGFHCRGKGEDIIGQSNLATLAPIPVSERTVALDDLAARLQPDTGEVTYKAATARDGQAFAELIPGLLDRSPPSPAELARWNALAHAIGYTLEIWRVDSDRYAVLSEQPDRRRGGGTYVFRLPVGRAAPAAGYPEPRFTIILQAPHVYFDLDTGNLATHVFFAAPYKHRIRALYMNSLHRYQIAPGKRDDSADSPADACHNADHLLNLATRLSAEHVSPLRVVQLHGFDDREDDGDPLDVIVSTSETALTDAVATALEQRFSKRDIRRYPTEFDELGGDTNEQRKVLAAHSDAGFVHLEMSRSFRKHVRKSKTRRDHLAVALVESALEVVAPAGSSP